MLLVKKNSDSCFGEYFESLLSDGNYHFLPCSRLLRAPVSRCFLSRLPHRILPGSRPLSNVVVHRPDTFPRHLFPEEFCEGGYRMCGGGVMPTFWGGAVCVSGVFLFRARSSPSSVECIQYKKQIWELLFCSLEY